MKTTTTLLIAMIIGSVTASAQTNFGITAGATFASMNASPKDDANNYNYKTGFTAGVFASVPITSHFRFEPALNFTQKGVVNEYEGSYPYENMKDKITLNYLEVPLNFNYSIKPNQGFYIGAGPSFGMGLSGKDKWEADGDSGSDNIKFGSSDDDDLKSFEIGANFQAGYKMTNGLIVSAGYNMGFNDILNWDDSYGEASMKNNYFSFKLGWTFNQKSK